MSTPESDAAGAVAPDPLTPVLTRRWLSPRSWSISTYEQLEGYTSLRTAFDAHPDQLIQLIKDSGLRGRGGAGFPTGMKWGFIPQDDGSGKGPGAKPKYLVINADEGEPGTCKDIPTMMADPHSLIEGCIVTSYAIRANFCAIYVRGEAVHCIRRLRAAVAEAKARGYLGTNILDSGFDLEIVVHAGAGAYICGEETALLESIEGFRGEPRNKPPFPSVSGLFGKPTAINNVETLYNVLEVLNVGGPSFAAVGGGRSTGSKLFCLSGAVARPGVYEIEFGATLRELLDLAGGVRGEMRTILLGGAAGGFVMPDQLDVVLTLEGARDIGATLGSGVVLVLDTDADLTGTLRRIAAFFRDESCGQCVPCRVGTVRQEEALARLERDAPIGSRETELALLDDLAQVMRDASICGLGQTAPAAISSALQLGLLEQVDRGSRNGKVPH